MSLINTNLEKEFNLASMNDEEENKKTDTIAILEEPTTLDHYKEIDKIEAGLPQVSGLDASDNEFDELAEYGIKAHFVVPVLNSAFSVIMRNSMPLLAANCWATTHFA